ncbi:hypothetical protein ACFV0C_22075 [Streptomyces sp. NPDC059568]
MGSTAMRRWQSRRRSSVSPVMTVTSPCSK